MRANQDLGRRRRPGHPGGIAVMLLLALALVPACSLDDPVSPNEPADLDGQNVNQFATFSGSIQLARSARRAPADGVTDVVIAAEVRDRNGNPVQNGTPINFSTDLGTIRGAGEDPATAGASTRATVFGGRASVALRSLLPGHATITAWIANVARRTQVQFEVTELDADLSLVFRIGSEDFLTILGAAPLDASIVATATTPEGSPIPGVNVEFEIIRDTSSGSGLGDAFLGGPAVSRTDANGEAVNTLFVRGAGEVVLRAKLLDPNLGTVVARSNQIIATTSEVTSSTVVDLTFDDGSTSGSAAPPAIRGLTATVTDLRSGQPVTGMPVRFRIIEDSSHSARLTDTEFSNTNSAGQAFSQVTAEEAGTVVIIAESFKEPGLELTGTSNQVVLQVLAGDLAVDLTFADGTTSTTGTVPLTLGLEALVEDIAAGEPVPGATVRFVIVEDTTGGASLASTGESVTDSSGIAANQVTASAAGAVVIVAEVLQNGEVIAASNEIALRAQ